MPFCRLAYQNKTKKDRNGKKKEDVKERDCYKTQNNEKRE